MDLNDVWEQNKRWILGVAAGLLLFYIGTMIVRSNKTPPERVCQLPLLSRL